MTFEDFDYVDIDYDSNTFTIIKEGHTYTYDIDSEMGLYQQIMGSGSVDKYEVYSQEEEYYVEDTGQGQTVGDRIRDLWERIKGGY